MTRNWSEQRAELLAHVDELRARARVSRDDASVRQLARGSGEPIAQHYHAQATRLDLAATVLLGAIQLVEDELSAPATTPPVNKTVVLCPLCGGKRHWKSPASVKQCAWRQWAVATGRIARDAGPAVAVPDETPENEAEYEAWMQAHPKLEAGTVPSERFLRQRARAVRNDPNPPAVDG